jgi:hypothetical protein
MNFHSVGCKVLLSLSICYVSFSVAFYICDLLYSLLRLSFGKQDQSSTPTWQWVTLAPIFGSFILYLLVNKIKVFCALVNETTYSYGRFSNFCGLIFGLLLHSVKSFLKVGIPAQIVKLLLSFLFTIYLLLHTYSQLEGSSCCVFMSSLKNKKRLNIDNKGCRQYFIHQKWSSFNTGGKRS